MALEDFLPALAAQIGTIPGLDGRVYYPHPDNGDGDTGMPAKLQEYPCVTLLPLSGSQMFGGAYIAEHKFELMAWACPGIDPTTIGLAMPFVRLMRDKLASRLKLGLNTLIDEVRPTEGDWYEGPKGFAYAEVPHTAVKFLITVKEHQPFTLAA